MIVFMKSKGKSFGFYPKGILGHGKPQCYLYQETMGDAVADRSPVAAVAVKTINDCSNET